MDDVTIGHGELNGPGVYADRDFIAGETTTAYDLQYIDEADYRALPGEDRLFVHSYGGRRYLYPAPARFVNHSGQPTCREGLRPKLLHRTSRHRQGRADHDRC